MKTYLLLLLLITAAPVLAAEKYYVTFVKGEVTLERTKARVKVGDALNPEDKVVFKDKAGKISCISPGKGRFDISAQSVKPGTKGELLAVLKSNLVPSSGTYHLSTRSLMFDGHDPKTYFHSAETAQHILLLTDEPLKIAPAYKLDAASFFFLQYQADGKTLTRKIPHDERGLWFSERLFDQQVPAKVMLCYQSAGRSSILAEFVPVFASRKEIAEQADLIRGTAGLSDKKKLRTEITAHIYENYGKLGSEELSRLFGI
jgi:hypothetical protein